MAYRVRIVLDDHPILQDGKMMISGENTETIEAEYPDLASALAAISPAYVNDSGDGLYRETLFSAVISQGQLKRLHCYVPMLDEAIYRDAVIAGHIAPNLLEILIEDIHVS
jgi:hypothetical protein